LSDRQILEFATKWLDADEAPKFLAKVRETPYGGAEVLPLTLAHLCAIYERTGKIPDRPRTVYRKIVRLLIEEWDEQRSIQRTPSIARFESDRKEEFLRALSYSLTRLTGSSSFRLSDLYEVYKHIAPRFGELPDRMHVIEEVVLGLLAVSCG